WLDFQFGRSSTKWTNEFVYPWDYDKWKAQIKENDAPKFPAHKLTVNSVAAWEKEAADIRKSVEWMLGDKTPGTLTDPFPLPKLGDTSQPAAPPRGGRGGAAPVTPVSLFDDIHGTKASGTSYGWINTAVQQTKKQKITFPSPSGFGTIEADLFTPSNVAADAKLPTVIWLHGYSSSLGYSWVYHYDVHPAVALAQAGYAVLAFDQSGFGSRQVEAAAFYNKYPRWSQMGHMVDETRAAIAVL